MVFNVTLFLFSIIFAFHQATSETLSSTQDTNNGHSNDTYASNTPFVSESDMESFIRNIWRDYPSFNISPMVTPLKEILYMSFNPDQMKLRICDDVSFSSYKKSYSNHQPDHITVMMPSLHIPLKYFKWLLELMSTLNDVDVQLRDKMIASVNNLKQLEKDGDLEMSKLIKKCEAIVIVPRLFKGNFCEISPIIEAYFPSLANLSLIKLGGAFLPYNSVKIITSENFQKPSIITWNDLENIQIPKDEDYISFKNLKIIIDHFQRNLTLLYLKHDQDNDGNSTDENSVPLSHWANVFDTLHTNVHRYLKLINQNGSEEYEKLPRIEFVKNTANQQEAETVSLQITKNPLSGEKFQFSANGLSGFGDMFHHSEIKKDDEESSTIGESRDIKDELNSPFVDLAPNPTYWQHSSLNQEYQNDDVNFSNENKITTVEPINEPGKNITNYDSPSSINTLDSICLDMNKLNNDFEISHFLQKKCSNLDDSTESRIRHNIQESLEKSKSYGSAVLRNTVSKKYFKNSKNDLFNGLNTNKKILSPVIGKLASSKTAMTRTSNPENLVTSSRKNGIQNSTIIEDTLVKEIEDKFKSSLI